MNQSLDDVIVAGLIAVVAFALAFYGLWSLVFGDSTEAIAAGILSIAFTKGIDR